MEDRQATRFREFKWTIVGPWTKKKVQTFGKVLSGHVVPGISVSEEENFSLMLKDGFPLDNASSKCSHYTFCTNT